MAHNEVFVDDGSLEALNTRWENAVKKYWSGSREFIPQLNIKPVVGNPFSSDGSDLELERAKEIFKQRRNGGNGV